MHRRTAIRRLATILLTTASFAEAQQPMRFEFVINLQTAKQIGVTINTDVLARATKIIR
jgi:ABC-type uncharacterized transport system substrate-binding protein